jgi:hypothetical protein
MGQVFLLGTILSHRATVGGGALLGDARPLGSGTCGGADYLGTCIIDLYIGCMAFTRVCLPYVRIVMTHVVFLVQSPP